MNKEIEARLLRLEKLICPKNIMVQTMFPEDIGNRIVPLKEFCDRCRKDSIIYEFIFKGDGNVEQIDLLIGLIDDLANNKL